MDEPTFYEIRIKGHLTRAWADWFEGMTITNLDIGEAAISGQLRDQAALHGVLRQISNLGLTLISVNPVADEDGSIHDV